MVGGGSVAVTSSVEVCEGSGRVVCILSGGTAAALGVGEPCGGMARGAQPMRITVKRVRRTAWKASEADMSDLSVSEFGLTLSS